VYTNTTSMAAAASAGGAGGDKKKVVLKETGLGIKVKKVRHSGRCAQQV